MADEIDLLFNKVFLETNDDDVDVLDLMVYVRTIKSLVLVLLVK